jgi:hypothetical protein
MNLVRGRKVYGRYIYAQAIVKKTEEPTDDSIVFLPNVYAVIAYNADGTKTAIFGNGAENNTIASLVFELTETGCGTCTIKFNALPTLAELSYKQRIDVFLFNDSRPWYSGYVITRPIVGTTETTYTFTIYGYYNLLEKVEIFGTYVGKEVSVIVRDIAKQAEAKIGIVYNADKIISTGYTIDTITFNGVTAKEALSQLSDFAIDYVYGVDTRRNLYFKPRTTTINEQARLWVGKHVDSYVPTWNVEKIVNWAKVKGNSTTETEDQWLAIVEDTASQALYGRQESIYTLPTYCTTTDAVRWGQNQINKYKGPIKSATLKTIRLEYPKADGSFSVRKLTTDGLMAIYPLEGEMQTYPITKLKYEVSAAKGIQLTMAEVGEQPITVDQYLANLERVAKNAELLSSVTSST